jgi:hypothetical protein
MWVRSPIDGLTLYALTIAVYDVIVIVSALNGMLENPRIRRIRVAPFHPDGAGGMGSIGRFAANLGYGIGTIGLSLSLAAIQDPASVVSMSNYSLVIEIGIYLVLAPILFVIPLWTAHSTMVASRDHLQKEISLEFNTAFAQMHAARSGSADAIEPLLEKVRQLDEAHTLVNRFPVWPVNVGSFRKFFGLILSPLVPAVFSVVVEWLTKLT